ncbi:MAG: DUF3858 domain-containing protein [Niabella sp.]
MKLLIIAVLLPTFLLNAQDKLNIKFGKLNKDDFNIQSPAIDSSTNAVVLADIGSSKIEGNNKGFFSLIYTQIRRIKVLNKKGFDAADVSIVLYTSGSDEEKLTDCKAITYNMENGELKQTKLEQKNIFKEKIDKNITVKKFTFPDVKEGSILEYTYTIESDFLTHLRAWEFQGTSWPRVYTQYSVKIPEFFSYIFLAQGYFPLKHENKSNFKGYSVSDTKGAQATEHYSLNGYENENTWIARDVPALKEETYTSSMDNHLSKIDFQLKQYQFPNNPPHDYMGNWTKAAEELLKRDDFGVEITRPNNWLSNDVDKIIAGSTNNMEKAQKIYAFVRDNFTATRHSGIYISDNTTLKDIFRKKSGHAGEINLLLIAMLRQARITADPVLISTRSHGWAHPFYPLMTKYNLAICNTQIDEKSIYLNASEPKMGFGRLSSECYNGAGFIVKPTPWNISLEPDSLREVKVTQLFVVNDNKKGLAGSFATTPGYYESSSLRQRLVKESLDDFTKETVKSYSFPVKITNARVDSLNQYDYPVQLKYEMQFYFDDQEIVYLNPMFSEATTKNPFSSAERKYPVEMPFKIGEVYVLNMEIPKGYKVEELPKSARVMLNDNEGIFEYLISATDQKIMMNSRIDIKKATFAPEDYQTLRDFFGYIVKKQAEQIVFKKIN